MAIVNQVVSDITGTIVTNGEAVEVTVKGHPKSSEAKKFDALREEVAGLKPVANLVEVELKFADGTTKDIACTYTEFAKVVPDEVVIKAQTNKGRRRGYSPTN